MALTGKQQELDLDGSGNITGKDFALLRERNKKQEGGEMTMPPEITTETPEENRSVDTYPNATPEELEAANQRPDDEMEEDYMDFIVEESLTEAEQNYLMESLEADPRLSMIFDKVVETASEFSGAGEVKGPGTGLTDSIPARLSDGEFVITEKATSQIGADNLQRMMDDAERAFDGGIMREKRQSGGAMTAQDDDEMELMAGTQVGDEIKKIMSLKANKAPSLS